MGDAAATDLKQTPLYALHQSLGAKFAPFAGYDMPIQYPSGILAEHHHVREKAGLFDVSHMGQGFLTPAGWREGADRSDEDHAAVAALLEELTPSDLAGLAPGEMRYSLLLNEEGGIEDDFMVARPFDPERQGELFLVVNAACKEADFERIAQALSRRAHVLRAENRALLALQGPRAAAAAETICPAALDMVFMNARTLPTTVGGDTVDAIWSRSGYTGEDGFEISVLSDHAPALADALLAHPDVQPIGLGARDSLRLEAGLCLYGHDMDAGRTPVEASLTWAVAKRRRAEANFPGAEHILTQIEDKPAERRVGLKLLGKAPAREGADIASKSGEIVGRVTSGGPGPSYGGPIAMGYVARAYAAPGTELDIIVRDRPRAAEVVATPFVKQTYYRG